MRHERLVVSRIVSELMNFYKLTPDQLLVLYDDIDIPQGWLRIRRGGSAGTHNGMRSVVACVNSEDFPRIRIGVGDREGGRDLKDHVLGRPGKQEQEALETAFCDAAKAAKLILDGKLMEAQAKFNKRHIGGTKAE